MANNDDNGSRGPSDGEAFGLGLLGGLVILFLLAVLAYLGCTIDDECRAWMKQYL